MAGVACRLVNNGGVFSITAGQESGNSGDQVAVSGAIPIHACSCDVTGHGTAVTNPRKDPQREKKERNLRREEKSAKFWAVRRRGSSGGRSSGGSGADGSGGGAVQQKKRKKSAPPKMKNADATPGL